MIDCICVPDENRISPESHRSRAKDPKRLFFGMSKVCLPKVVMRSDGAGCFRSIESSSRRWVCRPGACTQRTLAFLISAPVAFVVHKLVVYRGLCSIFLLFLFSLCFCFFLHLALMVWRFPGRWQLRPRGLELPIFGDTYVLAPCPGRAFAT